MVTNSAWWGEDVIPRIRWRIEIAAGDVIPDGYGVAWRLWHRDAAVCLPLPFNLIAGRLRNAWIAMQHNASVGFDRWTQAAIDAEQRGYARGYDTGYANAMRHVRIADEARR